MVYPLDPVRLKIQCDLVFIQLMLPGCIYDLMSRNIMPPFPPDRSPLSFTLFPFHAQFTNSHVPSIHELKENKNQVTLQQVKLSFILNDMKVHLKYRGPRLQST